MENELNQIFQLGFCWHVSQYLALPATSTPSERVLSTAGIAVDKRRYALTPAMVNSLVFLNKNSALLMSHDHESPPRAPLKEVLLPADADVSDLSDDGSELPHKEQESVPDEG